MKNIYANKAISETVETLSTKAIKNKRRFHVILGPLIKFANKKKIIIESFPNLDKNEQYIFAAGHSFPDEVASNLSVIKNHTYVLIGTTDQLINNPGMGILWLNGLIYVNKLSNDSRKDAYLRMKKVLDNGSSIMMFPEGVLNNSENLLCNNVYPGFYHLSMETGKRIVPIVSHTYNESNIIRIMASEPYDISQMQKKEALIWLRDELATLRFKMIEKEPMIKREDLTGDIHKQYMDYRRETYREVKWTQDVWDEEIMFYKEKGYITPSESIAYVDNINLKPNNIGIVAPILVRRLENEKYDFKKYMHENWDK